MKPEYLESLLLDRELGELSPAVAALLEDYLAGAPAAAQRAAELKATVDLARVATAPPATPAPRPLDLRALHRAAPTPPPLVFRPELFRLAACLAVGLGLGWFARPLTAPISTGGNLVPATALLASAPAEPRSHFWSVARLTATQRLPMATTGAGGRRPFR